MKKSKYQNNIIISNIPNAVSIIGLIINLYSFYNLYYNPSWSYVFLAVIGFHCDFIDGKIARKLNVTSKFGNTLDKIVDKTNQFSLLLLFYIKYKISFGFIILFLIREVIMLLLRHYKIKPATSSKLAKIKTYIFPYVFILFFMGYDILGKILLFGISMLNFYTLF